jgi:pilus assembly protein TadC
MTKIFTFNKFTIGHFLIPNKILKFEYKKKVSKLYEDVYNNRFNYRVITDLFFLSSIIGFFSYLFYYEFIFNLVKPLIGESVIAIFLLIFTTWTTSHLLIFYTLLFTYFFSKTGIFKKRTEEIENDLPEFLDNLISNMKGGLTLEKCLIKSVSPHQETFFKEITLINTKMMLGKTVVESLEEFRNKYNSPVVSRTFFLIIEGIKGGGNLVRPLEKVSQNLKKIYMLNNEIKSNISGTTAIIKLLTVIVAPILFSLSITLLDFISKLFELMASTKADIVSISSIPVEYIGYLSDFSHAMIILISLFSSLIVTSIRGEETHEAMKYLPINITIGIIIFDVATYFMIMFFGDILG